MFFTEDISWLPTVLLPADDVVPLATNRIMYLFILIMIYFSVVIIFISALNFSRQIANNMTFSYILVSNRVQR